LQIARYQKPRSKWRWAENKRWWHFFYSLILWEMKWRLGSLHREWQDLICNLENTTLAPVWKDERGLVNYIGDQQDSIVMAVRVEWSKVYLGLTDWIQGIMEMERLVINILTWLYKDSWDYRRKWDHPEKKIEDRLSLLKRPSSFFFPSTEIRESRLLPGHQYLRQI
jgi:hypothetical protein